MVDTKRLIKQMKGERVENRTPISNEMFLPNLSGDHSRGRVRTTPTTDFEIANKKYVDDNAGGGSGTMTTVKEGGVQLGGADIVTLDFDGNDFDLTESPDTEVNIVINDAGIDHDATTNFVANEHINHTSVTITAGVGLSGGGDISSTRTLTVDLNELGTETTIAAGDFIAMVDITDNGSQKITFANLELSIDHVNILNAGSNTHTQIDTHLADTSDAHSVSNDILTFTNKTFDANGAGNSLSNVDVTDLANGTDGELITWDSNGFAATVAVGTNTHVLTSNGVGAAPTFQAATGSATKEIYWDSTTFSPEGEIIIESTEIFGAILTSTDAFFLNLQIPADFTSLDAMEVMIVPDATETVNWSVESTFAKVGELVTANTGSQTSSLSVVDNTIIGLDIAAAFTGIEAGDIVGFKFNSDTSDIRVVGVRMKYS